MITENESNIFSDEEIANIQQFVDLLRKIRARVLREGVDLDKVRRELGMVKDPSSLEEGNE